MRLATVATLLLLALPSFAQDRFSITAGRYDAQFSTDVRVDPLGTELNLERDLLLRRSRGLNDFAIRWRPLEHHELEASYVSASRDGFANITREFRFNDRVYPVNAIATTTFDTKKWEATYTYWFNKNLGLILGGAGLSVDASVSARTPDLSLTITQRAKTSVPVALAGAQARVAFTPRVIGEVSAAALPHVKIDVYSGRAVSAAARLEFRVVHNIGIGAAYNYFNIDGTVTDPNFGGRLKLTAKGGEGFVRLAF